METQNQIDVLHSENMEWLKKLASYSDQINRMQSSLDNVAAVNISKSVMVDIEHFQNQLTIHKHRLNSLKHEIKTDEKLLDVHNQNANNHHASAKDQINTFEKIISDLEIEMNQFLQQAI